MDNVEKVLSNSGLRTTRQRKLILELLFRKGVPLSHAEILSMIDAHLDRVTLYRTLDTLKKCGVVHQVQGVDGVWRFCAHEQDAEGCPGDHPHFLCLYCGRMFCLLGQKMQRVEVPENMKVEGKQFVVYGACPECAAKNGGAADDEREDVN
ncbi:MAG: transcriptional repressor [Synergistes sp.]|nr:transcriptional repressor [Synergistes sp.]